MLTLVFRDRRAAALLPANVQRHAVSVAEAGQDAVFRHFDLADGFPSFQSLSPKNINNHRQQYAVSGSIWRHTRRLQYGRRLTMGDFVTSLRHDSYVHIDSLAYSMQYDRDVSHCLRSTMVSDEKCQTSRTYWLCSYWFPKDRQPIEKSDPGETTSRS